MKTSTENTSVVGLGESLKNKKSMEEVIDYLRKAKLFTVPEIARIARRPTRTVERWASGQMIPCKDVTMEIERIFNGLESHAETLKKRRLHGLTWDSKKNRWKLRLTIDTGGKTVGMRKSAHMPSHDPEIVAMVRDLTISCLRQFGLTVKPRIQKRND